MADFILTTTALSSYLYLVVIMSLSSQYILQHRFVLPACIWHLCSLFHIVCSVCTPGRKTASWIQDVSCNASQFSDFHCVNTNLKCCHLTHQPAASKQTIRLQPNYCDVWSVTPNIILPPDPQLSSLAACKLASQPVQCLCAFAAAGPRGCSARVCYSELVTLGTSVLALSHRGNPLSPRDHPHRRRVVCHPVPIDSTRGCSSAVLFIGLSHPT